MALPKHTLTGNIRDALGTDMSELAQVRAYAEPSQDINDLDANVLSLGRVPLTLDPTTGEFTVELTETGEAVAAWRIVVDYRDKVVSGLDRSLNKSFNSGYAEVTADKTLSQHIEDAGTLSLVPVSQQTLESVAAYAADAADSAAAAAAVGTTNDTVIAGRINDPASATTAALSASIASGVEVAEVGSGVSRFIARAQAGASLKIVTLGDSILAGVPASTPGTNDAATLLMNGLDARFPDATFTQSNRAVSGATTATIAITGALGNAITDAGDLYVIGFGRNDVTVDDASFGGAPTQGYKRERSLRFYEVMIRTIRARVPQADILIVTENPAATYSADGNQRTYQAGVRKLAAAYGCELADTYAAYGTSGYGSLLTDGVHPSLAGHVLYGDTMLDRFPATLARTAAGKARPTLSKGLRTPETVDTTIGNYGWTVDNGSAPSAAYTQSGAGWNGTYPRETSGVNDYLEWTFTGTDFGIRVDQSAGAAPVVDIRVDGVTTFTNQSLFLVPGSFSLYQFLATGLADGAHTIRVTLKSGTLRWYQAAWLAGAAGAAPGAVGGLRRMVSGRYYSQPRQSSVVAFPAAGDAFVVPLWVPEQTAFIKIGAHCSTLAASSTVTFGIYRSDANDQPGALLASTAAVSTATTGWKEASITETLTPGWWWLALLVLGGTPRFTAVDVSSPLVASSSAPNAFALSGYVDAGESTLPASWVSGLATVMPPAVALKAA